MDISKNGTDLTDRLEKTIRNTITQNGGENCKVEITRAETCNLTLDLDIKYTFKFELRNDRLSGRNNFSAEKYDIIKCDSIEQMNDAAKVTYDYDIRDTGFYEYIDDILENEDMKSIALLHSSPKHKQQSLGIIYTTISICSRCDGSRSVNCNSCHGRGQIPHFTCNGRGNKTCPSCHGGGRAVHQLGVNNPHNQLQLCRTCRGNGNVACACVNGTVACRSCTNGKTSCPNCKGRGEIEHYIAPYIQLSTFINWTISNTSKSTTDEDEELIKSFFFVHKLNDFEVTNNYFKFYYSDETEISEEDDNIINLSKVTGHAKITYIDFTIDGEEHEIIAAGDNLTVLGSTEFIDQVLNKTLLKIQKYTRKSGGFFRGRSYAFKGINIMQDIPILALFLPDDHKGKISKKSDNDLEVLGVSDILSEEKKEELAKYSMSFILNKRRNPIAWIWFFSIIIFYILGLYLHSEMSSQLTTYINFHQWSDKYLLISFLFMAFICSCIKQKLFKKHENLGKLPILEKKFRGGLFAWIFLIVASIELFY